MNKIILATIVLSVFILSGCSTCGYTKVGERKIKKVLSETCVGVVGCNYTYELDDGSIKQSFQGIQPVNENGFLLGWECTK